MALAQLLLQAYGMSINDIVPSFLSYTDSFSQLGDRNVDAAFALSGYPAGAVVQAQVNKNLKFIKLADGKLDQGLSKYKNYNKVVIPKSAYKTDSDGIVFGVNNMLVTDWEMDAVKVYKITKAIYDNMEEFKKINAYAKQINVQNSLKLRIPLHAGAAKYFDEK